MCIERRCLSSPWDVLECRLLCVRLFTSLSAGPTNATALDCKGQNAPWNSFPSAVRKRFVISVSAEPQWLIIASWQLPLQTLWSETTVSLKNSRILSIYVSVLTSSPILKGIMWLKSACLRAWRSVLLGWKLILLCQSALSDYWLPPSQIIPWKRQLFNA